MNPSSLNHTTEPHFSLTLHGTQITVLGTAHVSKTSAEVVQQMLDSGAYDAVAVELCPSRHQSLVKPDEMARMDLFQILREGKVTMIAASLALGAYQQRLAEQFGIEPGAEMRMALQGAREHHLPVLLIDRELGTTLKRSYRNVPWWKRFNLFAGLMASLVSREKISESEIEALKQGDMLETTFAQFADDSRELYEPLIAERDRYMAARLQSIARDGDYRHILAVVGAGHLQGIEAHLRTPSSAPAEVIRDMEQVPPPARWPKFVPWVIIALILTGFAIGFSRNPELGMSLVLMWIYINGGLAALGAIIARAHPGTVLTAALAAPLTSLNPTIGVGMVAAAVEIYLRKPNVGDFSNLRRDTMRLRGWWQNRVSRVFVVFMLTTLGSAIGTYVAGFTIFERLIN